MTKADEGLDHWDGPYGGFPPFHLATPQTIEAAVEAGIEAKRAEIAAIIANPDPPSFANSVEAFEDAGRALKRANTLRAAFVSTRAIGTMPEVQTRLAPKLSAFDTEIAYNDDLFARIDAVYQARDQLDPEQARLTKVLHARFVRAGAGLAREKRAELRELGQAIASAQARFQQNMINSVTDEPVWIEQESALVGLPADIIKAAAKAAAERGRPNAWAIINLRPLVWPVLQLARNRDLRRRVREMWVGRCSKDGPNDNRPIIAEVLKYRGRLAQLMGYPSYAHFATSALMATTPDIAMAQMMDVWEPVCRNTLERRDALQALAEADGLGEPIQAWDWLYYMEKLRQARFGLDAEAVKQYLSLDNVMAAMFDAAGRLHDLSFRHLPDAPVIHPDVKVYEVARNGAPLGVIWFDQLFREGKMRSSWQMELRAAESFREPVIAFSNVCSNIPKPDGDGPILMGWEYANVQFHEFGHALHMIMSQARYPSLGPMGVEWDLVEVPSQLNERWLYDPDLIRRHLRHHATGEAMPEAMIDAIEAGAKFERVFSVGVEYLAPAIVDMRMYLASDGSDVDPMAIEAQIYHELGMPPEVDAIFRLPNQYHSFTNEYASAVYAYLWADVLVADLIETFLDAPGGLYDAKVAQRWRDTILSVGTSVPGKQAFRNFANRDPDPGALMRRFQLA